MPRNPDLQTLKKNEILAYFNKLNSEMEFGVRKYTVAYCTAKTARKFFLAPKTIETYLYA